MAYHDALVKRDAKALRATMSQDNGGYLDNAVKKGKGEAEMRSMAKEHPDKTVRISRAGARQRRRADDRRRDRHHEAPGEAQLVNEGGRWRVDDELMDVVMK